MKRQIIMLMLCTLLFSLGLAGCGGTEAEETSAGGNKSLVAAGDAEKEEKLDDLKAQVDEAEAQKAAEEEAAKQAEEEAKKKAEEEAAKQAEEEAKKKAEEEAAKQAAEVAQAEQAPAQVQQSASQPAKQTTTQPAKQQTQQTQQPAQQQTATPKVATKADAQAYIGKSAGAMIAAIGAPNSSTYGSSCLEEDAEDGELYYNGFTVYTLRKDGVETVIDVE